jgi:hypothetical protein
MFWQSYDPTLVMFAGSSLANKYKTREKVTEIMEMMFEVEASEFN